MKKLFNPAVALINRIIGSTIDITQIKQAEKALRQSQQRYETLVHSIDGIVWEADAATFWFSFVSQQAERLLGYPVERWLTEPTFWADHIHPEDRTEAVDFCLAATAEKRDHGFEYRMIAADGRLIWLRDIVTVVVKDNQPIKLRGIMVDITRQKQAEEALNRYAHRLEVLHEIDRAILAAHSPQEIAQTALRHIRRLVPCQRAGLTLLDFETNEIVILATEAKYETQLEADSRLPIEGYQQIIDKLRQDRVFVHVDIRSLPGGDILFAEGIRAGISLPLIANEALIGTVNLMTDISDTFSEEDVNIAREVTDQLAIAIQQARLFEAEAQRRQEAEALRDTAAALNSTLNIDEILDRILWNIGRVVPHDAANVMLIESGIARIVRSRGYAERGLEEVVVGLRFIVADMAHQRQMAETGQPIVIQDAHADPGGLQVPETRWVRSYIGAPIRVKGQVIGFLFLDSATPGFYTPAHAERLQAFAEQAAVAIQNARLYAQSEQQAERLRVLHEIDQAILAVQSAEAIAQAAAHHLRQLLPCQRAGVTVFDFGADEMLTLVVDTDTETKIKAGRREPLEPYKKRIDKLAQGEIISIHVDSLPQEMTEVGYAEGIRSGISLPLIVQGELIGSVNLWALNSATFSMEQVDIAHEVADQLAIAIQQAQLLEQVQRHTVELEQRVADRTRELSALYDVTAVANESLDLSTTLERSLERVLGAMRSQAGTIHLLDEAGETLHLTVQQGVPPDLAAQLETRSTSDSLLGLIIKHGDPLIVPDLAFHPLTPQTGRNSFQAYIGVPMRARGQMLGVLSVARAREQPQFNVEEVALLTTIADQVGVVVESARLRQLAEQSAVMEERARLARDLHDSVTQLLYSVNLFATVGREAYHLGDMAQVNSCLTELGQIAQQALKEMRLLVYELRPLALTQEGLVGAVRQRLDAVERRTGVQAQLQADTMLDLPGRIEEALYHITQEALNNALKHATATAITVRIEATDGRVELEVTDNGSGFDPTAGDGQGGLGLTSMRERVEKLGGTLAVLSAPGEGTKVKVSLEVSQ